MYQWPVWPPPPLKTRHLTKLKKIFCGRHDMNVISWRYRRNLVKDDKQDCLNDAVVRPKTQDWRNDSQAIKPQEESLPSCTVPLVPLRLVMSRTSGSLCKTIHIWKLRLLKNQCLLLVTFKKVSYVFYMCQLTTEVASVHSSVCRVHRWVHDREFTMRFLWGMELFNLTLLLHECCSGEGIFLGFTCSYILTLLLLISVTRTRTLSCLQLHTVYTITLLCPGKGNPKPVLIVLKKEWQTQVLMFTKNKL